VRYRPQHIAGILQQHEAEDRGTSLDHGLRLGVTQNLHDALRHIRLPDLERIMWIDAICINQEQNPEKSHQVNLMRQIYMASSQVVLWLGEEKDSAIALSFLQKIASQPNGCADYTFTSEEDIPKWFACDDLFLKRPYWRRSWILQEVLNNRDIIVYIGAQKLLIEDLFALFTKYFSTRKALSSIGNTIPMEEQRSRIEKTGEANEVLSTDLWFRSAGAAESVPDSLVEMRPRFKHPPFEQPRLAALLYTFRDQLATNPKDKIYSLLGMAKKEYEIEINYENDAKKGGLTIRSLYTITTRKLLSRVLYVLLWIESPKRNISSGLGGVELPSWVPDFTHGQQLTPRCLYSSITLFHADKDFPGGLKAVPSSISERHGISQSGAFTLGALRTHMLSTSRRNGRKILQWKILICSSSSTMS
jgi:hypothetical protein